MPFMPPCFRFALRWLLLLLAVLAVATAQESPPSARTAQNTRTPPQTSSDSAPAAEPQPGIQDNSFLLEEAYNQEPGVVQHINSFTRFWNSHDWAYTFTQEWPVPGHARHQLSATIVALSPGDTGAGAGLGDVAINYRYQVLGNGLARLAFAPRLSLLAPTGSVRLGRGSGGWGWQMDLPFSLVLKPRLVTHLNIGGTFTPAMRNSQGDRAFASGYNLGQSFIWLATPRFNVVLETVWSGSESVVGRGDTQRSHDLLLNPGVRWAYNFKNGLQIVPGVGVPIGVGPSRGQRGLLLYLSFEHPLSIAK
jgi:hypothetical protein